MWESVSEPQPSPIEVSSGQKLGHAAAEVQIKCRIKLLALMPCWKPGGDLTWMLCIEDKAESAKGTSLHGWKIVAWSDFTHFPDRTDLSWHIKSITYGLLGEETLPHEPWLDREGRESVSTEEGGEFREVLTATCLEVENGVVFPERSHGKIIITRAVAGYTTAAFVFHYSVHVNIFFRMSFDLGRYMLNFKPKSSHFCEVIKWCSEVSVPDTEQQGKPVRVQ